MQPGRPAILSIQKRHIIFCRCHCQCSERSRRAAAEARQAVNRDCCSNTARFCHLSLFYRWASLDPIDLSVKQSLIRGQYHHYHHHQSKSCLPWPSTITHRVASFTQLKKCWRKKEKKKMTSMIQGKCHVSDLQSWTNQCLGYFILANHSKNIHWCMILFCTFSL